MKKITLLPLLFLSATLLGISPASASLLAPGTVLPPDIFSPLPGATLEASNNSGSVTSSNGKITFDLVAAVYSDPTNSFGAGDLTFVYQVSNSANSVDAIGRLTAVDFTGFQTDVGFVATGSAIPGGLFVDGTASPQLVDRGVSGDTVGFGYNNIASSTFLPGTTSVALVIQTNATAFAAGSFNVIDGGVSTVPAYEPTLAAVPESGSTAILLGLAMIGLLAGRQVSRRLVA